MYITDCETEVFIQRRSQREKYILSKKGGKNNGITEAKHNRETEGKKTKKKKNSLQQIKKRTRKAMY